MKDKNHNHNTNAAVKYTTQMKYFVCEMKKKDIVEFSHMTEKAQTETKDPHWKYILLSFLDKKTVFIIIECGA